MSWKHEIQCGKTPELIQRPLKNRDLAENFLKKYMTFNVGDIEVVEALTLLLDIVEEDGVAKAEWAIDIDTLPNN